VNCHILFVNWQSGPFSRWVEPVLLGGPAAPAVVPRDKATRQDLGPVRTQPGRGGNSPGPQRPPRSGQHLQRSRWEDGSTDCARPGRHAGIVTTPIGDPSASREPAGTGSAAAGSSVPAPPRIPVTVSRVISGRDSLSPARASRYSNRAAHRAVHSPRGGLPPHAAAIPRSAKPSGISSLLPETVRDAPPSWPASLHLPSSASP
jgi:hypothetical protein